jgi:beta-1,2-mannobiose phosphorylase / 1,2-beta-oligomannan phosphorylase
VIVTRAPENPIITAEMVLPSRPDFEVLGVFNPGVARHNGDVVLLLRVAEAPRKMSSALAAAPIFNSESGRIEIKRWQVTEEGPDVSDPRLVVDNGRTWLTSMSHFRVARSSDGIHFDVEGLPALTAATAYESFGVEDPRITQLDGVYWITYTAVSHYGGLYAALHRPMPEGLGQHSIWAASSTDLKSWGNHRIVATPRHGSWDDTKVGGGAAPFRVHHGKEDGWLAIYHGVTGDPPTYALGALLLNRHDPSRVRGRSRDPILIPEAPYEREGFFGKVVFTCGALTDGDLVRVYYGAADGVTAVADLSLQEILSGLADA